jgi:protoporphyrinogen oxidase
MGGVVILGAGLAGLGCALRLPGGRVFEARAHPGGHAYSHELGGVHFDEGAHICHSKDDDFLRLVCAAAGDVLEVAPSVVRNVWQGRWLTYPVQNHLHELPQEARVQALTDLVCAHAGGAGQEPADYRAWCRAQYGAFLAENFYERFTAKYWRVPGAELATDWLAGRLLPSQLPRIVRGAFAAEAERQAVFARFRYPARGGFFEFFRALYATVDVAHGERAVELDTRRKAVQFASGRREPYDCLASSIPLPVLMAITTDLPPALREQARLLRHTQLLCVNLVVNRPRLTDCHWFYVYDEDVEAARVSVPSNLAPGAAPPGQTALQAEVFRRDDEALPADVLVERAARQLGDLLHFGAGEVAALGHVVVPRAYVIADHRRAAVARAACAWFEERDVYPMGLYGRWKYVWSDEAFRQGREAGERIALRLRGGRRAG